MGATSSFSRMICQLRSPIKVGWGHIFRACGDYYTWTNELIDTNPKCLLFFKIDLQEHFPSLICLSADEFCQLLSWGGNFYVLKIVGP
jgi:hypothetical protein